MENTGQSGDMRENLMDDLKRIIKDAEEMLRGTGQQAGEGYQKARAKFESTLSSAKDSYATLEDQFMTVTRDAIDTTDEYVRANPWQAVGIGAAAGLLLGLLIARK